MAKTGKNRGMDAIFSTNVHTERAEGGLRGRERENSHCCVFNPVKGRAVAATAAVWFNGAREGTEVDRFTSKNRNSEL